MRILACRCYIIGSQTRTRRGQMTDPAFSGNSSQPMSTHLASASVRSGYVSGPITLHHFTLNPLLLLEPGPSFRPTITQISSASTASVSILTPNRGIRELMTFCNPLSGSLGQASYARIEEILHLYLAERVCAPSHTMSPIIASPLHSEIQLRESAAPSILMRDDDTCVVESAQHPLLLSFPFYR
jgi:hypothetical protein